MTGNETSATKCNASQKFRTTGHVNHSVKKAVRERARKREGGSFFFCTLANRREESVYVVGGGKEECVCVST